MISGKRRRAILFLLPLLLPALLRAAPAEAAPVTYVVQIIQYGSHYYYNAEPGKRFHIQAFRPRYRERFDRWVALDSDVFFDNQYARETSFIMPEHHVIIEARYRDDWEWGNFIGIGFGGGGCSTGAAPFAPLLLLGALYRRCSSKKLGFRPSKKA